MGAYQARPTTKCEKLEGSVDKIRYGVCSMQGWRKTMEDTHIVDTESLGEGISLFAVFDGHGGTEVSEYLKNNFVKVLKDNKNFIKKDYELALIQTFKELDQSLITPEVNDELIGFSTAPKELWEKPEIEGVAYSVGSTACVALVTLDAIFVANLGDSRCIISKKSKAYEMSIDHKPNLDSEKKRITAAGGFIKDNRIKGVLNLSRSFGDMGYKCDPERSPKKQMVINVPDICEQKRTKDLDFLFIACDGIWECMTSSEVCKFIGGKIKKHKKKMATLVQALFNKNLANDVKTSRGKGTDNMTGILVALK
ncbi:unnamed protein product [Moneuplotes crassus]|uniref:protein-serine/threonine phosphatase n=1 Tax=Euplotes crassus TaxID=5936 RepID=A0AAD1URB6_EUPCR|nr:unnamed protein product [Moneuplotes crassus]